MKKKSDMGLICSLAALMITLVPGMTQAQEFEGPYVAVEAGIGVIKIDGSTIVGPIDEVDNSGLVGAVLGYRSHVGANTRFVLGVEGTLGLYTNGTNERYGIYGIGGYRVGDKGLFYLRLGYSWLEGVQTGIGTGVDGLAFGGGYEFGISERINLRLDYRYINYGGVSIPDNTLDFDGHEITTAILFKF